MSVDIISFNSKSSSSELAFMLASCAKGNQPLPTSKIGGNTHLVK